MSGYLLAIAIIAVASLLAWIAYLRFCWLLVDRTKDPKALREAAVAAKAFRAPGVGAMAEAVARRRSVGESEELRREGP